MRRALNRLSEENFDLLVIGGGATGSCVARDASLRGLSVALIDKGDFAAATSAHNSKLVHGGLRYLRNFEIGLVRESLRERRTWLEIAPHLVHPLAFLLPMVETGWAQRAVMGAGLALYDLLALGDGLPTHRWLDAKAARAREAVLEQKGFEGAFEYYDAQMVSPERIALECLIHADAHGAAIANYVEAGTLIVRDGRVAGCKARDGQTGAEFDIRAKCVLVAAGPWADLFLGEALGRPPVHKLLRSKGIHILVPSFTQSALLVAAGSGHFFVMPWRGHTLIGTTDTQFRADPGSVGVSEADITGLLTTVNAYLPAANITRGMIEFFYAGLRPLVADGAVDTYHASRRAEIVDHGPEGVTGLFSALGGKWTTSRALAEKAVDGIVAKLRTNARPCATATSMLPGAERAELRDQLVTDGDWAARVRFAVREEMALTLADAVMRRTAIGQFGRPSPDTLEAAAAVMGEEMGWSAQRRAAEIASLMPIFQTYEGA